MTRAALDDGHTVVALDRSGAAGSVVDGSLRQVDVDLTDYPSVERAVRGCDAIVHLEWKNDPPALSVKDLWGYTGLAALVEAEHYRSATQRA